MIIFLISITNIQKIWDAARDVQY